jgi:hypothetical protein
MSEILHGSIKKAAKEELPLVQDSLSLESTMELQLLTLTGSVAHTSQRRFLKNPFSRGYLYCWRE